MILQARDRRWCLQCVFIVAIFGSFIALHTSFRKLGGAPPQTNGGVQRVQQSDTIQQLRIQQLSEDVEVKPILIDENVVHDDMADSEHIIRPTPTSFQPPTEIAVTPDQLSRWDPKLKNGYEIHQKLIDSWGIAQSDELEYAKYQIGEVKKPTKRVQPDHPHVGIRKWASKGGATMNTEVKDVGGIRGTVGSKPLKTGGLLMKIPSHLIIYSNYNLWTPQGRRCQEATSSPQEALVFFVLNDIVNNASSHFHEYYDLLPEDYSSHALHWSEQDLRMFAGSHFLRRRHSLLKNTWFESYTALKNCLKQDVPELTFPVWAWARTLVMSRNFNNGNLRALVPVGDMINHASSGESAKWSFDTKSRDFKLRATEHYREGKPLFISYGKHTVKRFLLWYGFVDSEAQVGRRECSGEYAEIKWKSKTDGEKITEISYESINTWFGKLFSDTEDRLPRESVFTQWIVTLLRSRKLSETKLSKFSTTLDEDREIIARPGFSKRKTASQGTLQEKQILYLLIKITDYLKVLLSNPVAKAKDFYEDILETLPVCALVPFVEAVGYISTAAST
eukprot:TRINITY_DN16719_c0_g1_i1.p1 TRINITY_DN16719_c0_g1~~TRINITY_DN16719_c0_g1_i1.p1  ORF type:complete len:562 (+),score=74.46 TRINITY_DN16719_c0_g1_i1:48-1733(+)